MRVRQFTQDDAHIFCREDQIVDGSSRFLRSARLGSTRTSAFECYAIKLALRPEQRFGADEMWDKAEKPSLRDAVAAGHAGRATPRNIGWEELPGEGAFYAPKLEFHLTDAIGRTWQCGTIQSDYGFCPSGSTRAMSARTARSHRPVMLHRAILGTFERFIGIMIEHYAGQAAGLARPGSGGGRDDRFGCR